MAQCSCPLSIPNHSSPYTPLSRHRAVPSSLFAHTWHWGNPKDTFPSFLINQTQHFFEDSPEVDLLNGTQPVPHLPALEASKEQCWLSVDQSSYTSTPQGKPPRCLFWERALHPFSLLEFVTPDKNKYHTTAPALGYFWQHHQVTEFQRALCVCVCTNQ